MKNGTGKASPRGSHFDPLVADAFLSEEEEVRKVAEAFGSEVDRLPACIDKTISKLLPVIYGQELCLSENA